MTRLRRLHVTPRAGLAPIAAGVAAAVAQALLGGSGPAWLAGTMLVAVAVVAVDARLAPPPSALEVRRLLPTTTTVDRPTSVGIEVRNPGDRGTLVDLHDAAPPSTGRRPRDHRVWLPPRSRATVHADLLPRRRGDLAFGPVTVRTHGPLGLAGRHEARDLAGRLRVLPRLPGRAEVELRLSGSLALLPGQRRTRLLGGGTEFDHLRDHRPDDDHRRINWPATARAGRTISTVLREERNQHVVLLVDASRAMAPPVGGVPRLEVAIDAAVAVAEMAARSGDHVGAVAFDRGIRARVPARSGRRQGARVLDALFAVEPSLDAAGHREAFARVLAEQRRRALLVLLTDLPDAGAIEPLLAAVPALLRHHLLLVGAVRDPAVDAALAAAPEDVDDVHAAGAAATILADRDGAVRRLTALGARVVDTTPEHLAGRLVDAYLDVKAAGRL